MAEIFSRLNDNGEKYFVDNIGRPIPLLRLEGKVFYGEDYDPNDPVKSKHKWGWADRPKVIRWLRRPKYEPFYNKPDSFGISGIRGSGKSALLVSIAAAYHARGGTVIDSYAANDAESCWWLVSPWSKDVILVEGEGVKWRFAGKSYATMPASQLDMKHPPENKIVIILKSGFGPLGSASEILYYNFLDDMSYQAAHRMTWNKDVADIILIRESNEFIGSKLRSNSRAYNIKAAADEFVKFHTQALHSGWGIVYDRARYIATDKDVRDLSTWQIWKATGMQSWPRELNWVFRYVKPSFLRYMPPYLGLLAGEKGNLAVIKFPLPYWLEKAKTGVSVLDELGISAEYDMSVITKRVGALRQSSAPGAPRVVTDEMHRQIISEHIGDGTIAAPHGESLVKLAIRYNLNRTTVNREWAAHTMGQCSCGASQQVV
jgi:hypothetical protein